MTYLWPNANVYTDKDCLDHYANICIWDAEVWEILKVVAQWNDKDMASEVTWVSTDIALQLKLPCHLDRNPTVLIVIIPRS